MKTKKMKKSIIGMVVLLLLTFNFLTLRTSFSQNIGINTTGAVPNSSSILDLNTGNTFTSPNGKGLLIPKVSLTSTSDVTTITSPATSLVIYNTNAGMTNGNGAGYYYYNGSQWIYMAAPSNGPGTSGQVLASQGSGNAPKWLSAGGGANGGTSALGTAMMTAYMDSMGMFRPHANNCGADAFVPLFSGATVGYCMEINVRADQYWTDAIRTCLAVGKRLPESFEWQVGCDNAYALGLVGMGSQWEWASNFALPMSTGSGNGVGAAVFGPCGCNCANWARLGDGSGNRNSYWFRCVH